MSYQSFDFHGGSPAELYAQLLPLYLPGPGFASAEPTTTSLDAQKPGATNVDWSQSLPPHHATPHQPQHHEPYHVPEDAPAVTADAYATPQAQPQLQSYYSAQQQLPDLDAFMPTTLYSNAGRLKMHICWSCYKTFDRPSTLRKHTVVHTGEKPFVCDVPACNGRFGLKSNFKRHLRMHERDRLRAESADAKAESVGESSRDSIINRATTKVSPAPDAQSVATPPPVLKSSRTLSDVDHRHGRGVRAWIPYRREATQEVPADIGLEPGPSHANSASSHV